MFLCTLSVLVSLVVANSSALQKQFETIEWPVTRNLYNIPQEIKNQVPVNFAALNLRESRLKYRPDINTFRHRPDLHKHPKILDTQQKRINEMKNSFKVSKYEKYSGQTRKRPVNKFAGLKKNSQLRTNKLSGKYTNTQRPIIFSTEVNIESTKIPTVELQSTLSSEDIANSLANINKAINALPRQMVTVVRDEIDCNDDPTKNIENVRGPPCTFFRKWPGTDGHSSFWMKKAFPQNWAAFIK